MFTEFTKFYVDYVDEYSMMLTMNNLPPTLRYGDESFSDDDFRELTVDISPAYDWNSEAWDDGKVRLLATKALVDTFGEDAELVWWNEN